jgi:bifunctional DNA-binding transcriptional regulator/antitoxin component of YhaV-PrlF toxin-antitoxin module
MKTENTYVKIDSRNRITIPKAMASELSDLYKIYEKGGKIILEPIKEVPKEEQWLLDPKNKAIVQELKKALKQKAHISINLDDLEK